MILNRSCGRTSRVGLRPQPPDRGPETTVLGHGAQSLSLSTTASQPRTHISRFEVCLDADLQIYYMSGHVALDMFLVWIESHTSHKMAFLKLLLPHIPRLCPSPQVWEVSERQHCKWRTRRTGRQPANLHLPEYQDLLASDSATVLLVSAGVSPQQAFPNKRPLRSLCLGCDPLHRQ